MTEAKSEITLKFNELPTAITVVLQLLVMVW